MSARAAAASALVAAGTLAGSAAQANGEPLFLPYQIRWIEDDSRIAIMEKSRRVGADFCEAFRVVRERMNGSRNLDYWYTSADEDAALEFMRYVQLFALELYGAALEIVDGHEAFGKEDIRVMRLTFPEVDGRRPRVTAMSSNPKGFRSKGGDIGISEFAHHDHADELWKAASPARLWGGRIRILSTHNGESSKFNQLIEQARRHTDPDTYGDARPSDIEASLHRVDIHDAVADGLARRIFNVTGREYLGDESDRQFIDECRRDCADELVWAEEFEAKPNAEAGSYFPYELPRPCVSATCPRPTSDLDRFIADIIEHAKNDPVFLGGDVGRINDRFVLYATAGRKTRSTVGILVYHRQDFQAMEHALNRVMTLPSPRVRRLSLDATGIGMQLAERITRRFRTRAEAVMFTAAVKADLVTTCRRDVEEQTVLLPDDPKVLAELNSFRKVTTSAGNVRFDAERSRDGHADIATGLMLSLHAADRPSSPRFLNLKAMGAGGL
ncbi:MAG: hypothetical protein AAF747_11150, partial [Planctomycetota bacterium]